MTLVNFVGEPAAERGVPASTVVELLDVVNEIFASPCLRRLNGPIDALVFEHREERFSDVLSQRTPVRPMDDRTPRSVTLARNSADVLLSPIESAWSLICRSAHRV